ncbi:DUF397 domain-containing protein [Streptomyces sp. B1866]|uniref:DUF397 domain-containing protein n=1 Tax=Streptomyces sp. B1866 TaxID=3075431 RepID=UPI0028928E2C|nr:DUF397 domain-containing protein [Streptomyces sp. B1866]MDT3400805.1 DUF397 domain-containing protein [Streptomyces sp. B1866]
MASSRIPDASAISPWRKSSYSGIDNGNCIEVADGFPGIAPVRDSKDPHGPAVSFPADAWVAFIATVKRADMLDA